MRFYAFVGRTEEQEGQNRSRPILAFLSFQSLSFSSESNSLSEFRRIFPTLLNTFRSLFLHLPFVFQAMGNFAAGQTLLSGGNRGFS